MEIRSILCFVVGLLVTPTTAFGVQRCQKSSPSALRMVDPGSGAQKNSPQAVPSADDARRQPSHDRDERRDGRITTVQIECRRELPPFVTPDQARDAWLSFVWTKGGGLPALTIPTDREADASFPRKRLILPAFLEEELVDTGGDARGGSIREEVMVQYRISRWLIPDYVDDSHSGTIDFYKKPGDDTAPMMVWNVRFEVFGRYKLWNALTESLISQACDNLVAYLRPPLVYTRLTRLVGIATPQQAMEKWLDFVWDQGGGLPVNKPLVLKPRETRMIVPPFLKESILSINEEGNKIEYQVDNPSIFTAFPCHTHAGRIEFKIQEEEGAEDAAVNMIWTVQVKPYHNSEGYVRNFTSAIITILSRNLKSHIEEPGATVSIRPPREAGDNVFQLRKDSWLGGVLDARLRDNRSMMEQTLAISQPYTWGRSSDDEEAGEGEKWTTSEA